MLQVLRWRLVIVAFEGSNKMWDILETSLPCGFLLLRSFFQQPDGQNKPLPDDILVEGDGKGFLEVCAELGPSNSLGGCDPLDCELFP